MAKDFIIINQEKFVTSVTDALHRHLDEMQNECHRNG